MEHVPYCRVFTGKACSAHCSWEAMIALSFRPFCSFDGRRVSLWYLSAGLRYTTVHQGTSSRRAPPHVLLAPPCAASLPAVPTMPTAVRMMPPGPMTGPLAPGPRMGPIIPVVLRSHDDGRGIHHGRRWDDHHGYRCDDDRGGIDRHPDAHRDIDPRVGRQGKSQTCETQERTQTHYPQQSSRLHHCVSSFTSSTNNRRNHLFISWCTDSA